MHRNFFILYVLAVLVAVPARAHAYIGPGAGLSAIGAFIALVAAVGLAFLGFLWFPIKRFLRKRRGPPDDDGQDPE